MNCFQNGICGDSLVSLSYNFLMILPVTMMLMLVDEIWSNIFLRLPSVPLWSVPLPQRSVYPCSLALWRLQGDNHHFIIQWNESTTSIQTRSTPLLTDRCLTSNLCRTARTGLMRKTAPRSRVLTTSSTVHRWQLFFCFRRDAEILTLSKLSSECSMWLFQLPRCSFKRFARIKQLQLAVDAKVQFP